MKKISFFIIVLTIVILPTITKAHPGATDAYGCHTCKTNCANWGLSTGEYHCHNAKTLTQPISPIKSTYGANGTGYTQPAPEYSNTYTTYSSCPANSYEYLGNCKCNYGYIAKNNSCINANTYCSSIDYNSEYDSLAGTCKCRYGYVVKDNKCISQSSYCSSVDYNSEWDSVSKSCKCRYGYLISTDTFGNKKCVTENEYCINLYGNNSKYDTIKDVCVCKSGYYFNNSKCVLDTTNNFGLNYTLFTNYNTDKCPQNSTLNNLDNKCYCNNGYILNSDSSGCVLLTCGTNSTKINNVCTCNDGYILRNNTCISYTDDCKLHFGNNVYGEKGDNNNSTCYCVPNYKWDANRTSCVEDITCPINSILFGGECKCLDDLKLNPDKTACIDKNIVTSCQVGYKLDTNSNKCIIDDIYNLEQKAKSKGKEKISGPSKIKLYTNIEKIDSNLWGNKK